MPNILFLSPIIPFPLQYNGLSVRVLPLHQEIAKRHRCFLAALSHDDTKLLALRETGIYDDIVTFPEREHGVPRWFRHVFVFTGNLDRKSRPRVFSHITGRLQEYIELHAIDIVIAHTLAIHDYLESLKGVFKILDDIDCQTLLFERRQRYLQRGSLIERIPYQFLQARSACQERLLSAKFDAVTTVSPVDREYLCMLNNGDSSRIAVVPNGVSPEIMADSPKAEHAMTRSIAFWGALDFPPNATAIAFFHRDVYVPFLEHLGIKWFIIGKKPHPHIAEQFERHPDIILTGFVEDLRSLVLSIPISINPMKMGGGLKNKVIEAFAMRRLVVSNALGMESIPEAEAGRHFILAEQPRQMADAIIRYLDMPDERNRIAGEARQLVERHYRWSVAGAKYNAVIDDVLAQPKPGREEAGR